MTLTISFILRIENLEFVAVGGISVSQTHLFSAPEPKAQVHYCDHALSAVRRSHSNFQLLLQTVERNSTRLDRKQDLNVLYQVCVFLCRSKKRRWPPWPLIGWDIFDFSETAEHNSTKLDRKQDLNVLYEIFVFFGPIRKTRWPRLPLIGWDIFDFSSKTAEWNLMKFDRKQGLYVLYVFCFLGRLEKQDGLPDLWLAEVSSTSHLKPLNGIQRNMIGSKISTSATNFVFFGPIGKTRLPPWPLIGWDISTSPLKLLNGIQGTLTGSKISKSSTNVVFRADWKNKISTLVSDWLRRIRLLLWNHWTEFNETWQEARSQRPLRRLCFSGQSQKQDGRPVRSVN